VAAGTGVSRRPPDTEIIEMGQAMLLTVLIIIVAMLLVLMVRRSRRKP
jgi:hypothetical protein